ncbi:hypothetical protein GCM10009765_11310 [Fodinicola feengrottensis]|uniref:Uncharacterized protein n=1 Tax=Fodinicola feengrottensis TaxID=435914 RepID=A0ABN2G143_9ACTN
MPGAIVSALTSAAVSGWAPAAVAGPLSAVAAVNAAKAAIAVIAVVLLRDMRSLGVERQENARFPGSARRPATSPSGAAEEDKSR